MPSSKSAVTVYELYAALCVFTAPVFMMFAYVIGLLGDPWTSRFIFLISIVLFLIPFIFGKPEKRRR